MSMVAMAASSMLRHVYAVAEGIPAVMSARNIGLVLASSEGMFVNGIA